MRMLFRIFKRDLKKIKTNYAAIIIVTGLCIIPSLYAWINIAASWDPYANTGNLPVAIINKDEGAIINATEVNVGAQVIEKLKENKSIKWEMVDEWQANNALNEGTYYAIIEIPQNFSSGLVSLTTTNPRKPSIIYKVNEKANAIATKITNVAKDKLTKEIKENFIKSVNEKTFSEFNKVGLHLDNTRPKVLGIKDVVNTANSQLGEIKKFIDTSSNNAKDLNEYISKVKNDLPNITSQINNLEKVTEASQKLVNATRDNLIKINGDINSNIIDLQVLVQKINMALKDLKDSTISKLENEKNLNEAKTSIDNISKLIDSNIKTLEEINKNLNDSNLKSLIQSLNNAKIVVDNEKNVISNLQNSILNGGTIQENSQLIDSIIKINDELTNKITLISNEFYKNGTNSINNAANIMNLGLTQTNSILETTKIIVPQLNALANYGIASSNQAIKNAEDLKIKISIIQDEINDLSSKLNALNEESLNNIIEIMQKNPNEMANFIASPIEVKEEDVYGEGIFGVGLTPFYTVLAIWVGALLTAALLTTECEDFDSGAQPNILQRHFGKMILFVIINLIQALIATLGDYFILGVKAYNLSLLFVFSALTAIAFTIIIFTLVSLLGNVGKAIAVIIMVFQIAGAGGIYPIQTNPEIFGVLYPIWPFTYAINGFREAIAGPVWKTVDTSITVLLIYSAVFVILSVFKKPLHHLTHFMEHKFKESEL
ncbi:putative membrane protein [Clostridium cavendishii DSM 21758]|uniref:Putative membrane protein n=1 Tax=Clostridium cavendishii DSM 21758 TaxID=1121302 RepID=A0A1M6CTW4_9CLOT|nr:YhgE/Pip domain-containing protein [Clostridium cavendishii]SHI64301.1 putative membrane protein [Clostridium cavendishii DSM 21758]